MSTPVKKPWAILLCKFSDDPNDPAQTRIMDLATQWRATQSQAFILGNLNASWDTDSRTILDLYNYFFTTAGIFTTNVTNYFYAMSHGLIDVKGNKVFPITMDITSAQGAALAAAPGGSAYQNMMFQKAKKILLSQYGVDWKTFYGVAVSFQSADYGSQGGSFDGGPGVYMDIRFVKNNGMGAWGHELGHGFGLGHSRTDGQLTSNCTGGAPNDYTDPFDIMSYGCVFSSPDTWYGVKGPGMNAWNMRSMQGLDETRVWKGLALYNFSNYVTLNPIHMPGSPGYLAAELLGVGGDSNYLIEFRVPKLWDEGIGEPGVMVHRYDAGHSYIMKGTSGQKILKVGDVFEKGQGSLSRLKVISIDPVGLTAEILVCYSPGPLTKTKLKIHFQFEAVYGTCDVGVPVESSVSTFYFKLSNLICDVSYKVMWSVSGASPASGQMNNANYFSIVTPDPSVTVTVSVMIMLPDGTVLNDSFTFNSISGQMARWKYFICTILKERMLPHPWWEWDPEKLRPIFNIYDEKEMRLLEQRTEKMLQTIRRIAKGAE